MGLLLLTAWSGLLVATTPLNGRVDLLALSCIGLAAVWTLLAATPPVVVDLLDGQLVVRRGRRSETFHLASPYLRVRIIGEVATPSWALELERADGSCLVLGEPTVRSAELHPVVEHHQEVAGRLRALREARFSR